MPDQIQTKEHHARYHPPFHFFFAPAILILLVIAIYELVRYPSLVAAAQVLLVLVVAVAGFLARFNAMKVQDRLIRLEERLRLSTLLPQHLLPTIYSLSERQLIALRFASDEEIPELVQRVAAQNLAPKAIKASITKWRPDYWRV
jgi:hypothetical protein